MYGLLRFIAGSILLRVAFTSAVPTFRSSFGFSLEPPQNVKLRRLIGLRDARPGVELARFSSSVHQSESNYINYPQCSAVGASAIRKLVLTCNDDTNSTACCATPLAKNQAAVCVVGGCCYRYLGTDFSSVRGKILVSTPWSATGVSQRKSVSNIIQSDCFGFPTEDVQCDYNCAVALSDGETSLPCGETGITVPDENTEYIPLSDCSAQKVISKQTNVGAIAGGAAGAVILLVILALILLFCFRKGNLKCFQSKEKDAAKDSSASGNPHEVGDAATATMTPPYVPLPDTKFYEPESVAPPPPASHINQWGSEQVPYSTTQGYGQSAGLSIDYNSMPGHDISKSEKVAWNSSTRATNEGQDSSLSRSPYLNGVGGRHIGTDGLSTLTGSQDTRASGE